MIYRMRYDIMQRPQGLYPLDNSLNQAPCASVQPTRR